MFTYIKYNTLVRFHKPRSRLSSLLPMKSFMHFAQLLIGDVRIDLGRGDGGMAQHRLHRTDIRAAH